jgi:hypothetical protein
MTSKVRLHKQRQKAYNMEVPIPDPARLDALRNDDRNPRIPGVRGAAAAEAVAQTAAEAMRLSVKDQTLESLVSQDP